MNLDGSLTGVTPPSSDAKSRFIEDNRCIGRYRFRGWRSQGNSPGTVTLNSCCCGFRTYATGKNPKGRELTAQALETVTPGADTVLALNIDRLETFKIQRRFLNINKRRLTRVLESLGSHQLDRRFPRTLGKCATVESLAAVAYLVAAGTFTKFVPPPQLEVPGTHNVITSDCNDALSYSAWHANRVEEIDYLVVTSWGGNSGQQVRRRRRLVGLLVRTPGVALATSTKGDATEPFPY